MLGGWTKKLPSRIELVKGAKGNRITHRIAIESIDDIDDLVRSWLKRAYELSQ